ncbi:MAG: dockerin type I domain-containing protein [bacterium]
MLDACQCIGDLNFDGLVNAADLSILLAFWGPVGVFEAADLTGDNVINGADLTILLARWGPCN